MSQSLRLILASRSPRRAALLHHAGYRFKQTNPPYIDPPQPLPNIDPEDLALELSRKKAISMRASILPCHVILSADTICIDADGQPVGQPANRKQARQTIRRFIDAPHDVITAATLLDKTGDKLIELLDRAQVLIGTLNDDQLEGYLDTEQWRGKAGGYNLFDRQADGWPISVQGDPTTVVGLPMAQLQPALHRLGILPD